MDVDENGGLFEGYQLKLNSYDLGVDIELADVVQRMRFEHPEVKAVVLRSGKDKVFCAGANIRMLGGAAHAHKVNFCKFTNETRNTFEAAGAESGQHYIAAVKGACAGGGYELALACDHILLDRRRLELGRVAGGAAAGGAAGHRRPDARHRQAQGAARPRRRVLLHRGGREGQARGGMAAGRRGRRQFAIRARLWPRARASSPRSRARAAERERRQPDAARSQVRRRRLCDLFAGRGRRSSATRSVATISLRGPDTEAPASVAALHAQGAQTWALRLARELDDALLHLRLNELELGVVVFKTHGDSAKVLAARGLPQRPSRRRLVRARNPALLEARAEAHRPDLALAGRADRERLVLRRRPGRDRLRLRPQLHDEGRVRGRQPRAGRDHAQRRQFRAVPDVERPHAAADALPRRAGLGRGSRAPPRASRSTREAAIELGLVTFAFDDIDWDDEVRIFLEERASFSPDAMTGMEANLRFPGPETMETRIFGRLTAWQNWIFQRPNAVGENGALKRYGTRQARRVRHAPRLTGALHQPRFEEATKCPNWSTSATTR